jgi:hypothetical protein
MPSISQVIGNRFLTVFEYPVWWDFPFDRPYLDLYHRCALALRAGAADVMKQQQARAIPIEKPLCTPSLDLADEVVRLDQYLAACRACVK